MLARLLDTTTLWRAVAVVRNWRHVLDLGDLRALVVQRAHSRFTAWAWALDTHFQVFHAAFDRDFTSSFSSNLRCERGRFTRTLEASTTRGRPRQSIALTVGDGDDGIVEGSVNVCNTFCNVLLDLLAYASCCCATLLLSHVISLDYFLSD